MHMCIICDCWIWVLCHRNQCEPTAARMMHAQRCVDAAAVTWLRIHLGIFLVLFTETWLTQPVRSRWSLIDSRTLCPHAALVNSLFKDGAARIAFVFFQPLESHWCSRSVEHYKLRCSVWQHDEGHMMLTLQPGLPQNTFIPNYSALAIVFSGVNATLADKFRDKVCSVKPIVCFRTHFILSSILKV